MFVPLVLLQKADRLSQTMEVSLFDSIFPAQNTLEFTHTDIVLKIYLEVASFHIP